VFRSEEMCELSLLVHQKYVEVVTRAIASEGGFHQIDTSYLSRDGDSEGVSWRDRVQEYVALERRLSRMAEALGVDTHRPGDLVDVDLDGDIAWLRGQLADIEQEVLPVVDEIERDQQRAAELASVRDQILPLSKLNVSFDLPMRLTFLHAVIGAIPAQNLDRFNASLLHIPHVIVSLGSAPAGTLVALLGSARDRDVLERAAQSAYMVPVAIPRGYGGTPSAILADVEKEAALIEERKSGRSGRMSGLRESWGERLVALSRRVTVDLGLLKAMERFGQARHVYLIAGWVPKRRVSALIDVVQRAADGTAAVDITPASNSSDREGVPTTLGNRGWLASFQQLVTNYATPAYGELDPTPLVAVTFVLMFGVMFGDLGHGSVLALAGLALTKGWISSLASMASFGPVLLANGLSAMFFGLLYGSVFGVEDWLPALWLRPLENIMTILMATVAMGGIISLVGFALNIINGLRDRDWKRVLFHRYGVAGLWLYFGLIVVVATAFTDLVLPKGVAPLLILPPVLGLMLADPLANLIAGKRPLIHEGIVLYLIEAFFELFESFIGYLSGTLSYVRLGAFAVAHAGLSSVFFVLADMMGGPSSLLYYVVLLAGNLFIIGFEGLIVGIQTLRLEYYEFFSKFYRGGGEPYRPLGLAGNKE
jgi:V/A-type H+/Na+-transporting ATPase subunit I